jgi:redox-sensitive bicupin YhaK (pirin superfamily)
MTEKFFRANLFGFTSYGLPFPRRKRTRRRRANTFHQTPYREDGPVRVILGRFGGTGSPIRAPEGINYLHVRLTDGQRWRYTPPAGHTVAWLSVDQGRLRSSETIDAGQLAVFDEYGGAINLQADGATSFVIGSAIKHPHPLVLGNYSVHTSAEALAQGEAEIRRIGQRLRAEGRL